jgi:DNA-binding NarL/FixJ family response regulator
MTKKHLGVLLLEARDTDAAMILKELEKGGFHAAVNRVSSSGEFNKALREFEPDLILSDHGLPDFSSTAILKASRSVRPQTPVIILVNAPAEDTVGDCMRAGAENMIAKSHIGRLIAAIRTALAIRTPLQKLTTRQLEVLRLVAEGYRTREIARHLDLSVKTVESHRQQVMKRLGIRSIAGLVRYAMRVGFVTQTSETFEARSA